ncbi:adenosylcobinamide-phosphate synthase CbiB [Desulfobaculum sp. SPO524]|jgi:adenosylcobinamide-phosphate synthase|uniref:adenosylcobinamide-phosphate synthase CbiB n=1 Tax=Desulfobaculum sp. SPO524 TaxID=3378071 RepID=UPI003852DCBC
MIVHQDFLVALFLPVVAVLADVLIGDPHRLPHPVCLLGWVAARLEEAARRTTGAMRLKGVLGVCILAGGSGAAVWGLIHLPVIGMAVGLYLAYAGLALGQLLREARSVARLMDGGDLDGARKALSMLVSRDTAHLSEAEVRSGLAETLSENLNDGFVAPFFYLALGGPVALWVYKAVSTLDSMWGYMTPRYRQFGWAAARLDDVLAWAPARLTAVVMVLVAWCMGARTKGVWARIAADAGKSSSPNAGWPMAAAAWLIGASMGGPAIYFGQLKHKPQLGPKRLDWDTEATERLMRLVLLSGLACAALVLGVLGLTHCLV